MMTFAGRMREQMKILGRFRTSELADAMSVETFKERNLVSGTIKDFLGRGEVVRVERGIYEYVPRPGKITGRQRLWNAVRRMPGPWFSLDDLEQITSINRNTIKKFCQWLVSDGYATRVANGHFRRTGDYAVEIPADKKKCGQMADWRKRLKNVASNLNDLVNEIETGGDK